MSVMPHREPLSTLHYELIQGLIQRGACPNNTQLAAKLDATEPEVRQLLRELAAIHGVVLHPHIDEPWIVHPFSLTPTLNWIEGRTGSWWAPCVWCALGVTALVPSPTRIHTRYGAEAELLVIDVIDGQADRPDVWVHFAIPPARAWNNVHQHCALVLPFHSPEEIRDWCARHGTQMGEAVPLPRVQQLAQAWYGSHASPQWRKWSIAEAQAIFSNAGLTSEFWQLQSRDGHF